MTDLLGLISQQWQHVGELWRHSAWHAALLLMPFILLLELPLHGLTLLGNLQAALRRTLEPAKQGHYQPLVSCIITCYSEGDTLHPTLATLCEQLYAGRIELIVVIDGAVQNRATLKAARDFIRLYARRYPNRTIRLLPRRQRGGRVAALNSGLLYAQGDVVMALDGDTSFDNDMVSRCVAHFANPRVCAVGGALQVRNASASLLAGLQALEYLLTLNLAKVGLAEFNVINNVSGAFGVFRRETLQQIGGWNTGTAEDMDMTLRIKQYTRRTGCLIHFEPLAIGFTDVPHKLSTLLRQRLRWDGDLGYIYLRKHQFSFKPGLVGWPNMLMQIWNGLLFQIVWPFLLLIYTLLLWFWMPVAQWFGLVVLIYLFYTVTSGLLLLAYWLLLSRRRSRELWLLLVLPFYGAYGYLSRLWGAFALMNELLRRGHEDTSMAPWWVLRRGVRF